MKKRLFYCTESGTLYSESALRRFFEDLKASGDTEQESFKDYLSACMFWNNGTLVEIGGAYVLRYCQSCGGYFIIINGDQIRSVEHVEL